MIQYESNVNMLDGMVEYVELGRHMKRINFGTNMKEKRMRFP